MEKNIISWHEQGQTELIEEYIKTINKNELLNVVMAFPQIGLYFTEEFKKDKELIKKLLIGNIKMYQFLPEEIKLDRQLALDIVEKDETMHKHLLKRFKRDKYFLLDAVARNGLVFHKIHKSFKGCKDVAYLALNNTKNDEGKSYMVISSFSEKLKKEIGTDEPLKYLESVLLHQKLHTDLSDDIAAIKKMKL